MSSVTPVAQIPGRNVNTGAVTLTAKYGRLEVALDQPGLPERMRQLVGTGLEFVEGDDRPGRVEDDGRLTGADVLADLHASTLRCAVLTGVNWVSSPLCIPRIAP